MTTAAKTEACPTCKKPADDVYKPFCSKRCADLDLGKWLDGAYVIAGSSPLDHSIGSDDDETGDI